MAPGGAPGLQNQCGAVKGPGSGSIPTHSRHSFFTRLGTEQMSAPFSFSMSQSTPASRLFIIVLALIGFLGPVAYFAWYTLYGGSEWEDARRIEKMIKLDAAREAETALANGDYRLYCTGGILNPTVPGIGYPQDKYEHIFGYKGFTTFPTETLLDERRNLTAKQRRLNADAIQYMANFNRIVYATVNQRFPQSQEERKE